MQDLSKSMLISALLSGCIVAGDRQSCPSRKISGYEPHTKAMPSSAGPAQQTNLLRFELMQIEASSAQQCQSGERISFLSIAEPMRKYNR